MTTQSTIGPSIPRRAGYGSIVITPLPDEPRRAKVEISISAPSAPGGQIAWAVFQGPCGSPTPPVTDVNEFPSIDVSNNGGAAVRTEMGLDLDTHLSYHANIYWSSRATDVSDVMMCANLKFSGPT